MKPLFIFTFSGIKFMNHELGLRDTHIVKLHNTYNFFSEQKILELKRIMYYYWIIYKKKKSII